MQRFFERLDALGHIENETRWALWLDRAIFIFLVLTFVSAPHSIAATQIAWITGMFLWFIRLAVKPRPTLKLKAIDIALWAFFIWSAFTSVVSYAPDISIDKLRGVAIFLIFYFAYYNLRSLKSVYFVAFTLVVSCMVNVAWTPVQRLLGRGVEIHGLSPDGPLAKAALWDGDTLLKANGRKLRTPEDLIAALSANETAEVTFYRPDFEFSVDVKRENLLAGTSALQQLGFARWNKSRNWRSSGFYGHYTTYAEVLQLIGSLIFGLLVASLPLRRKKTDAGLPSRTVQILLFLAMLGTGVALLMTVTRASQLAFAISAALIVLLGASRKWIFAAAGIGLPIVLLGLLVLQQSRQVGFFDANDDSIKWRQTVWAEGYNLWTAGPRNMMVGVGMDTIKRYAVEWHLFDDGRLPIGHFHSMPLQLLVERGIPALILWLLIIAIYARSLWRGLRRCYEDPSADWRRVGILLGCIGGLLGIVASGMVHYNMGDQEVAMVFFLLMALGMRAAAEDTPIVSAVPAA
jgi:hypothetical protein